MVVHCLAYTNTCCPSWNKLKHTLSVHLNVQIVVTLFNYTAYTSSVVQFREFTDPLIAVRQSKGPERSTHLSVSIELETSTLLIACPQKRQSLHDPMSIFARRCINIICPANQKLNPGSPKNRSYCFWLSALSSGSVTFAATKMLQNNATKR